MIVLADVSGKGMAAALLMSATRGMLRSLAEACSSPAEILSRLNRLLIEDLPTGKFVTLVYAVFDPQRSQVTFASAGHLQPVLLSGNEPRFIETEQGLPLGLGPGKYSRNFSFATSRVPIRSLQRWHHRGNESRRRGVRPSASTGALARIGRFTGEPAREC